MASFKNLISNTSAQISSGGTITGDLVINGDLQVDGGGSLSFDEIVEGTSTIKVTNTSAFLVEKADGTDVLKVDTTNSDLYITGDLDITGSITNATWTGDVIASAYLDSDTAHLSGTQTFSGAKTFSSAVVMDDTQVIDITNAEALLVRKNSDGGDIFIVDTNTPLIKMGGNLTFTHDIATISSTTGLLQFRILETGQDMLFDAGADFKFRDTDDSNATRVTIQSGTGNIGIGTTTPMGDSDGISGLEIGGGANVGLTLKSTGSSQVYTFWADGSGNISLQDNTNDLTRLRVASNGNVSIGGTHTASGILDVRANSSKIGFGTDSSADFGEIYFGSGVAINFAHETNDNAGGIINYRGYDNGTSQFRDLTIMDGKGNTVAFFDGSASSSTFSGVTTVQTDSSPAFVVEDANGDNQFQVNLNASTGGEIAVSDGGGSEKVRFSARSGGDSYITNAGSFGFGIGTNDPKEKLHVSTGNDSNSGNITFLIGGTEGTNARTGRIIKNTSSPYEMTIRANDFSGSGNLILNDDGGNVSIGTTDTPLTKLDVHGTSTAGFGTPQVAITGRDNANHYFTMGFGYTNGTTKLPAEIGFFEGTSSGNTKGSLVFATRNATTDTAPTERMRIDEVGNIGIGTDSPDDYYATQLVLDCPDNGGMTFLSGNTTHASGIFFADGTGASAYRGQMVYDHNNDSFGIWTGATNAMMIDSSQAVAFSGALSKGSGSFKIDHPLESKKDTHHLVHSFVEAPQADNIYRGKATLSSGSVEINLDTVSGMSEGTFVLLNTDIQCFTSNESDWDAVKGSVSGNKLTISCQNTDSTATVSWLVIGERQDQHMIDTNWTDENGKVIVEPLKD